MILYILFDTNNSGLWFKTCLYDLYLRWPINPVWYLNFLNNNFLPVTKGSYILTITQTSPWWVAATEFLKWGEFFPRIDVATRLIILPNGYLTYILHNNKHYKNDRYDYYTP